MSAEFPEVSRSSPSERVRAIQSNAPLSGVRHRVVVLGSPSLALQLRSRLPRHWQVTLVTPAPVETETVDGLDVVVGDGTSALVLQRAGIAEARAMIAALEQEQANAEACRLARERFQVNQVLLIAHRDRALSSGEWSAGEYEVISASAALATAVRNRLEQATVAWEAVGLGEGEILQVTLHRSSPVVGRALRTFRPEGWTVAAVFRQGALVIPNGDTVLEASDQLLIIGRPELIPAVGEYLRIGRTRFPLPYGTEIAVLAAGVPAMDHLRGVERVAGASGVSVLHMHVAEQATPAQDVPAHLGETPLLWHWHRQPAPALAEELLEQREVGCLCFLLQTSTETRLKRSMNWRTLLGMAKPLLLIRGTETIRRVILVVSEELGSPMIADVALDFSEMLDAPLTALVVQPPAWLREEETYTPADWLQRVADNRRLHVDIVGRNGNPLRETLRMAAPGDLVVIGRSQRARQRPLLRPDPVQYLALHLRVSCVVVPAEQQQ